MQNISKNASLSPVLSVVKDQVTTTSLEISRVFEKPHADVMKSVRKLVEEIPNNFHKGNFSLVEIIEENAIGGKVDKSYYELTKDGFVLLAMGYTGAKAMKFKIAYIDAFNKMEAALLNQSTGGALTPAQQRRVQVAVADRVYATGAQKTDKAGSSALFQAMHRAIKTRFMVGTYKDIPSVCFDDLMTYIATCPIEAAKAIEGPKPPIDETALALRVADVIMKQVQPQVIRYEKTSDIGDLLVSKLAEVKGDILMEVANNMLAMKQAIVNDISIRINPVALNEPMPRGQWQKTWDCLSDTHSALSRAVEQFRVDVTNTLPQKQIQDIPKGEDVLEFVRLHYSNMETMARQINVLSEVLMWKSPKVAGANMELGKPRY